MMKHPTLLPLSFLVILSACSSSEMTESQMKEIVNGKNALLEESFLEQDTSQLKDIYAEDARLSPNGDDFYVGRDAIIKFWAKDFQSSKLVKMDTETQSVSGDREVIYETGITSIEFMADDTLRKSSVKFINVWRRQPDESYKLAIDFWNSPKK
jgi:ketosteroid isomerase-like protein